MDTNDIPELVENTEFDLKKKEIEGKQRVLEHAVELMSCVYYTTYDSGGSVYPEEMAALAKCIEYCEDVIEAMEIRRNGGRFSDEGHDAEFQQNLYRLMGIKTTTASSD